MCRMTKYQNHIISGIWQQKWQCHTYTETFPTVTGNSLHEYKKCNVRIYTFNTLCTHTVLMSVVGPNLKRIPVLIWCHYEQKTVCTEYWRCKCGHHISCIRAGSFLFVQLGAAQPIKKLCSVWYLFLCVDLSFSINQNSHNINMSLVWCFH